MYYTLKLVKLKILEQHFQCWCYSYPTSTCLTARATSVLIHLIKQKVSSLDQFGLGRIIENEMQFGEKIYENNKK